MRTTLAVTTEPASEPVSIDLFKQHCRIDSNADDDLLPGYLVTARVMAEGYLSRALLRQTLLWTLRPESALDPDEQSRFQNRLRGVLELPRAPVQSIVAVTTLDWWGNTTTIAAATLPIVPPAPIIGYVADLQLEPATLLIGGETVLSGGFALRCTKLQHVQVSMTAGYADADSVPQPTAHAIMMTAAFLYEHRGDAGGTMPDAATWLLDRTRLQFLGG